MSDHSLLLPRKGSKFLIVLIMLGEIPLNISQWTREERFEHEPGVNDLILLHRELYRHDRFLYAMHEYPFSKSTMAKTLNEVIPRKDYEFFVARIPYSGEWLGWTALSFNIGGNEAKTLSDECEARLERTEMYSQILKGWKLDDTGKKSNVYDSIKRLSSSLQAEHLPPNCCIINTLVFLPQYEETGVAHQLIGRVINFWKDRVMVGTEWAIWVQTPTAFRYIYIIHGFKEVGEYEVNLDDHGFPPEGQRSVSGTYEWKFMVLRGASGSATVEPGGAQNPDQGKDEEHVAARKIDKGKSNGKGKEQRSRDVEEHFAARKLEKGKDKERRSGTMEELAVAPKLDKGKGKGKEHRIQSPRIDENNDLARGDISEDEEEQTNAWEEAERRLRDIQNRWGPPPLPGEVATLVRIQRRAEAQGFDPTRVSEGRGVKQQLGNVRPANPKEPRAHTLQGNAEVTGQLPTNLIPTKSEEDLIEAMRKGGVDEEEIERVCALAFRPTDEAEEG